MSQHSIDLMIVGAQKAGTSSLIRYLDVHPDLCIHSQAEITCFVNDDEYADAERDWNLCLNRYFQSTPSQKLVGKSVGIMYHRPALERLHRHNPRIRLVVMLRDPVDRAYSGYWYARRKGWEPLTSFEEAIVADSGRFGSDWLRARNCAYLERSDYPRHLQEIFRLFDRNQVQIFFHEELAAAPAAITQAIWRALGVREMELTVDGKRHNRAALPRWNCVNTLLNAPLTSRLGNLLLSRETRQRLRRFITQYNEQTVTLPPLATATRQQLTQHFAPSVRQLEELLGQPITCWQTTSDKCST